MTSHCISISSFQRVLKEDNHFQGQGFLSVSLSPKPSQFTGVSSSSSSSPLKQINREETSHHWVSVISMAMSLGCCSCWSAIVSGEVSVTRSSSSSTSTQRLFFSPSPPTPSANLRMVRSITCAAAKSTATGKPRGGIMKPKPISPLMQELLGVPEIARTEALKKIWAYIKEHNLQDPQNKKVIVCDEKLKKIFAGKERVGFLEISGLINPHFLKPAAEES